jgi:GNAT superfamily N-acetyltransferase
MNKITYHTNDIANLDKIFTLSKRIFKTTTQEEIDKYYNKEKWIENANKGILVTATIDSEVVGFVISYPKNESDFHMWIGGVASRHRRIGIWAELYRQTYDYAKDKGYKKLSFTTRQKRFPNMYLFAKKEGFNEYKTEMVDDPQLGNIEKAYFEKNL